MTALKAHPAADIWPMLAEDELRRMADDILANGQRHSIVVLEGDGRILDGRNRYAACQIAGVEPDVIEVHAADPDGYVWSANGERRQATVTQQAAAWALHHQHLRVNRRWAYGATLEFPDSGNSSRFRNAVFDAGHVLDWLGPDTLRTVVAGAQLEPLVKDAKARRDLTTARDALPDDLRVLVEAGSLSLDEAEALSTREARERKESLQRSRDRLESFLEGWDQFRTLADDPDRADILAILMDSARDRILTIEKEFM